MIWGSSIGNELGVDPNVILQTSHGRRSIDVLKDLDASKANWECTFFFPDILLHLPLSHIAIPIWKLL